VPATRPLTRATRAWPLKNGVHLARVPRKKADKDIAGTRLPKRRFRRLTTRSSTTERTFLDGARTWMLPLRPLPVCDMARPSRSARRQVCYRRRPGESRHRAPSAGSDGRPPGWPSSRRPVSGKIIRSAQSKLPGPRISRASAVCSGVTSYGCAPSACSAASANIFGPRTAPPFFLPAGRIRRLCPTGLAVPRRKRR
jgi:hypothetical protein